jgi:hypothetical protein
MLIVTEFITTLFLTGFTGFLIGNWNEGDEIVILGYSRGKSVSLSF